MTLAPRHGADLINFVPIFIQNYYKIVFCFLFCAFYRSSSVRTPIRCRIWKGNLEVLRRKLNSAKRKCRLLSSQLRKERKNREKNEKRLRNEIFRLKTEQQRSDRSILTNIFTTQQKKFLETGHRVRWAEEDVIRASSIRYISRKG